MKYILSLCLLLSVVTLSKADVPKVVPLPAPEVDKWNKLEGAVPGKLFVMAAEPASKWKLLSKADGVELRQFDSGKTGVFLAATPGVYQLLVISPGGDLNQLEIVVEGAVPTPPKPPTPVVDPLKEVLTKLFAEDQSSDKKEAAKDLAELYKQAAVLATSKDVTTSRALLEKCQKAASVLVGTDKLIALRKVVSAQLAALLPTDAPLTAEQRKSTSDLFTKLSSIFTSLGE